VLGLPFCTETAVVGRLAVLVVVMREGTDVVVLEDGAVTRDIVLDTVAPFLEAVAAVFRDVVAAVILDVVAALLLDVVVVDPEAKDLARKVPEEVAGRVTTLDVELVAEAAGPAREREAGTEDVRVNDGAIERVGRCEVGLARDVVVVEGCPTEVVFT
jgi:hypothetical protein